jgi:phosphoribosylformylglycinamidine cyclo-ligase
MSGENVNNNEATRLYRESGVDIEKADKLVDWLKDGGADQTTKYGSAVAGVGGFAALFRPDFSKLEKPLLVTGTDGVGTKVMLGCEYDNVKGLGQDLVAMCVNDLYTLGARPLFFLDYYATGALDENQFKDIVTGIKTALSACEAILIGGETAEMPGLYEKGHFDLAGFIVGCVDENKVLGPHRVKNGDTLYALESSGFHSNGFSLVRKWVKENTPASEVIEKLLEPTKLYFEIPQLVDKLGVDKIHAAANITGGGISGNLPRVMPKGAECSVDFDSIPVQPWVREFVESNGAQLKDVETTFNLGCGMIISVSSNAESEVEQELSTLGLGFKKIGSVSLTGQSNETAKVTFI